jgi:zinc protease
MLYVVIVFLLSVIQVRGQEILDQPIPVDSNLIIGKLDNGLTYYIRKNRKPENRVEMRLVVKAGSVLEDEDQQGLAHFVEHMAFNGTKNFAKNDLVHYMQSVGVQFGPEVNAFTSLNETVYMLTLPTDSAHILQKGYQIMEDWAHNISFDEQEIDKERGVIIEEWRLIQGLSQRLINRLFPAIFEGSEYAERLPIGKKEVIEGAPYSALKRFYSDWYRPELMAFIVVGDIDPAETERTIQSHFSGIQNPDKLRVRGNFPVPDQAGTKLLVVTDKEMPVVQVAMFCKTRVKKAMIQKDYRKALMYSMISDMLAQRLSELRERPDPPVASAQGSFASIVPEVSFFQLTSLVPEKVIERGLEAMVTECERAIRHGFTESELTRRKSEYMTMIENAYNERDKTLSSELASECSRNFLLDEPIPGIAFEYNFAREYIHGISLDEVNALLRESITSDNRLLLVVAPEKNDLTMAPESRMQEIIQSVHTAEIPPYSDKTSGSVLLQNKPRKGKILLTKKNDDLDVYEMKLSNGARVILKPTDFKNDEILFTAFSPGGYSLCPAEDQQSALLADDVINETGLAKFSASDLDKLLAGKKVSINAYISDFYEGLHGSSSPRDLESMFQLAYLYFTEPRKDSAMFNTLLDIRRGYYKNANSMPETYFDDQFNRAITNNHPRADVIPSEEDLGRVSLNRILEIYHDRFADGADFTFLFVGSFKVDSIKSFIEQYLAGLPTLKRQESWQDLGIRPPAKKTDLSVRKGSDPKSRIGLYFEISRNYSVADEFAFASLGQLLSLRYLDVIREELSGAYTLRAYADLVKVPYDHAMLNIMIPCSPDNTEKLTKAVLDEIRQIQKRGVSPEDLVKVKETQRRSLEKNLKENNYWLYALANVYKLNDPILITGASERINALSSQQIQEAAAQINLKRYVRVILYPEK